MSIERLKAMKEQFMSCIESQMHDLKHVDAEELGEVVDMVKDMEEAIYYCTIVEAMHESDKNNEQRIQPVSNNYYYSTDYPIRYPEMYRTIDRNNGYMYYDRDMRYNDTYSSGGAQSNAQRMTYMEPYHTTEAIRDPREGRSYIQRKMYMEGKEHNRSKDQQMKELESYMQELSKDVTDMIKDASPEEKAILRQKMTTLASKIA